MGISLQFWVIASGPAENSLQPELWGSEPPSHLLGERNLLLQNNIPPGSQGFTDPQETAQKFSSVARPLHNPVELMAWNEESFTQSRVGGWEQDRRGECLVPGMP